MAHRAGRVALALTIVAALVLAAAPPAGTTPALKVSPDTGLVDAQSVAVTASSLPAKVPFEIRECPASSPTDCDVLGGSYGTTDPSGTVSVTVALDAAFTTYQGTEVDCRSAPGTCALVGEAFPSGAPFVSLTAPLAFDSRAPLAPPPVATVTPSTGLLDGEVVHVAGSGFRPRLYPEAVECARNAADFSACDAMTFPMTVDASGHLSSDFPLVATMDVRGTQVDCRVTACELLVTEAYTFTPRLSATIPLDFTHDGALRPPPVLRAAPSRRLADQSVVQLTGSGFRPLSYVTLGICAASTSPPRCQLDYTMSHQTDTSGNLTIALTAHTVIQSDSGAVVDCRRAPGCVAAVVDPFGTRLLASTRIGFAAGAAAPSFPVLTIGARGPFAERQVVPVSGHGYQPSSSVGLTECTLARGLPDQCDTGSFQDTVTDAHGNLAAQFMMTAFVEFADGSEADCRRVPCALVARPFSFGGGLPGFTGVDLGRPSAPQGRYLDPVFRSVDVQRGIVYRHTVDEHGRPVDLALDVYAPPHDGATRRPVIMLMFGGYFAFGNRVQLETLARAFAMRGYVVVNIDYRTRPELLTTGGNFGAAISDAQDDARAGVQWIRAHAASLGIDQRAIVAMGWSAGAITALNLAHPWLTPAPPGSTVVAAVSMAGLMLGQPVHATDPPSLTFGGNHDSILPFTTEVSSCAAIRSGGAACDMVAYAAARPAPQADPCVTYAVPCTYVLGRDEDHSIPFTERHDILERTSVFLANRVLRPLGLVHGRVTGAGG